MTTKTSVAVEVAVAAAVAVAATRWRQRFVLAMLSKFLGACNTACCQLLLPAPAACSCCHAAGVKVTRIYKIHIDAANVIYQRVTGTQQCIKRQSGHKEAASRSARAAAPVAGMYNESASLFGAHIQLITKLTHPGVCNAPWDTFLIL